MLINASVWQLFGYRHKKRQKYYTLGFTRDSLWI